MAWIIIVVMLLAVLGTIMGLRTTPHDQALGRLREQARATGLQPRLVAAPGWTGYRKPDGRTGGMLALYSLIPSAGNLIAMQARVIDGRLSVVAGDNRVQDWPWPLPGCYAVESEGNRVGVYWNEEQDLNGTQLHALHEALTALAQVLSR